mmetsp:Transcript_10825/g.25643  ORF Transcript_10825/g.25643 Transcript_10825/m.25643 type:complete len:203 (+) Transcript_10825:1900-2508(+)
MVRITYRFENWYRGIMEIDFSSSIILTLTLHVCPESRYAVAFPWQIDGYNTPVDAVLGKKDNKKGRQQQPFATRLWGEPLVIYRDSKDELVAMADVCPHRSAPLSMGYVENDELVCRYHGWRFGDDGKCVGAYIQWIIVRTDLQYPILILTRQKLAHTSFFANKSIAYGCRHPYTSRRRRAWRRKRSGRGKNVEASHKIELW